MLLHERGFTREQVLLRLTELGRKRWEFVAVVGHDQLDSLVLKRPRDAAMPLI